jgi:nucleoside phosphorylase
MLEFSAIISAVKPRERTDQYVILAALYFLEAHRTPVTARQVTDLLTLHLGRSAPANVNASLRSYTSFVEAAGAVRPLRWSLTNKGLDQLRSLSGLDLMTPVTESDFQTDIAFLCALQDPEFTALLRAGGGAERWQTAGSARFTHVFRTTELARKSGKSLSVVGTVSTSMGLTAAAIATTHLILQFKPRIVAMTGIAAGTRGRDRQFGDVLVADPSVDYSSGKVVLENGIRGFQPDPYPIGLNARLRCVLRRYQSTPQVFESIRHRWKGRLPCTSNRLHLGPVGAADQVIDDATRILEIQRNWRKLIGVEMETYGVYRACHEAPEPKPRVVSFKSVCDFAAEKKDSWQAYAAFTAAEFAFEFFRSEWDALWPTT